MIDFFTYENNVITPIPRSELERVNKGSKSIRPFLSNGENHSYAGINVGCPHIKTNFTEGDFGYIESGDKDMVFNIISTTRDVFPNLALVMWNSSKLFKDDIISQFNAVEEGSYVTQYGEPIVVLTLHKPLLVTKRKVTL